MAETRQLRRSSSNWRTCCPQLPMAHLVYHYWNEWWSCTTTSSLLPQLLPPDSPCHPAGQTRSTAISSTAPPPWHSCGTFRLSVAHHTIHGRASTHVVVAATVLASQLAPHHFCIFDTLPVHIHRTRLFLTVRHMFCTQDPSLLLVIPVALVHATLLPLFTLHLFFHHLFLLIHFLVVLPQAGLVCEPGGLHLEGGYLCWFGLGQGWVWRSGQVTIGGGRGPGTVAGGPP